MNKIGLYVHIPFCKSKCPYCDFYSLRADENTFEQYTASVLSAIETWSNKLHLQADTLYLGGGTPSVLGSNRIGKIIKKAIETFSCNGEITVECNPSSIETDFFKKVQDSGANRISLGLQSAIDTERRALGRTSTGTQVQQAINSAKSAGINNISLDVMLGIPNQSRQSLISTLDFCLNSGVKHISAYMLKLEEGTFFYKNAHKLNLPDDDFTADLYLEMVEMLHKNGFEQYEISNFSIPGFESRHNLKYWNCCQYLGIGPGAHSFINGKRFYYPSDIDLFLNGFEPIPDGNGGNLQEHVMLGLRLKKGINLNKLEKIYPEFNLKSVMMQCEFFKKNKFMEINGYNVNLTPKGFLISNLIIEKIIENC